MQTEEEEEEEEEKKKKKKKGRKKERKEKQKKEGGGGGNVNGKHGQGTNYQLPDRPRIFLGNRAILLFDPLYGVPLNAIPAFVPVVCRSLICPGLT